MGSFEEETYSTVFTSLRHPIRRKILRTLSAGPQSFSDLQRTLGIESSHLTYHLEGLTTLLAKTEHGEYALSSLGRIAVSTMKQVEEPPSTPLRTQFWPRFWRRERPHALALGIICILLGIGLVGVFAYHMLAMNDQNSIISLLNSQFTALQNQILSDNSMINSLNSQKAELENQLASNNSIVAADDSTIANLQRQITTLQNQASKHASDSLSTVPGTNATLWSFNTGGPVDSSPTIADGVVYVGSWNNNIYALNAYSGVRIWNYTTGNSIVFSSAAVANGVVYVGSGDGDVYAFNASTGTLIWNCRVGDLVWSSPAVANGMVYVGSGHSNVDALNASSGALVWSYDTGDEVVSSPALDNGVVFIGSLNGNVYALNAADGAYVWSYQTGSYVCSSPAVASGVVYVSTDGSGNVVRDSDVYALNASTGALLWSYATGGFSSPAVADGLVYVGGSDERLYALNATTGVCVWNYMTGEASSPAVVGGLVFVGDANYGRVYALDAFTGALVWSYQTGGSVGSSPAVSGGVVFIGSGDGNVYAFGPPPLSVSVSPSSAVMDVGESQLFNSTVAGGASPYTYQWYLNGAPVSGAVNQTWTFTPDSTGSYTVYVEVTDASNAVATSNTVNTSVGV